MVRQSLVEGSVLDTVEAAMIQARLEAGNIMSFLFDAEMSWALQCRVMVDADDLIEARRLVETGDFRDPDPPGS